MDPYLEHPELWPDVHHGLIEATREALAPLLRPKYRVAIEKRSYVDEANGLMLVGRPDVTIVKERVATYGSSDSGSSPRVVTLPMPDVIEEAYLEIRDVQGGEVVTVIEILSPTNKRAGEGRRIYEQKRQRVLCSATHLVEIDLIRAGTPMPLLGSASTKPYRILVSRSAERPRAMLYDFSLSDPVPVLVVPLGPGDLEPPLSLQVLLRDLYDRAGYDLAIDYRAEAVPPLSAEDTKWAHALLAAKRLR
jgi:hypothetical protein